MKKFVQYILTMFLLLFICVKGNSQVVNDNTYLILFSDSIKDEYGYKDQKGDVVIPLDKYGICFTDTFYSYAIVLKTQLGFVAINRNEDVLYEVFPFDNGPDPASDGLFRIIVNGKIGYADSATGKIIIKPQFSCAFPFENGIAKVSFDCKDEKDGEHSSWLSDKWLYISKTGKKIR